MLSRRTCLHGLVCMTRRARGITGAPERASAPGQGPWGPRALLLGRAYMQGGRRGGKRPAQLSMSQETQDPPPNPTPCTQTEGGASRLKPTKVKGLQPLFSRPLGKELKPVCQERRQGPSASPGGGRGDPSLRALLWSTCPPWEGRSPGHLPT